MPSGDLETAAAAPLLPPLASSLAHEPPATPPPADCLGVGSFIFFTLGADFLLPWNAYITVVDYFAFLYPDASVDRVFSASYMLSCLLKSYPSSSSCSASRNPALGRKKEWKNVEDEWWVPLLVSGWWNLENEYVGLINRNIKLSTFTKG
jgi:hypothetical protein